MKLAVYVLIGFSAILAVIGVTYLFADQIRFESCGAQKPWWQNPRVRAGLILLLGVAGPFGLTVIVSPMLAVLGVPHSFDLDWQLSNFAISCVLLVGTGRASALQRLLPAAKAQTISWLVATECFLERHIRAWWLPRAAVALLYSCLPHGGASTIAIAIALIGDRQMEQSFLAGARS